MPVDSPTTRPLDRNFGRTLVALTLVAFAVRAAALLLEPRCSLAGDESSWLALGLRELGRPNRGLSPLRNRLVFYPPLYPYFIAILHRAFGTLAGILWVQAALGALLVPAVGRAGRSAFGAKVGLVAAALAAVYPDLVWFSVHFWSETLFVVLLWWALEQLLRADESGSRTAAASAGILFGLTTLTRELALYLAPLAALWLMRAHLLGARAAPRRGAVARAVVFASCLVLTLAPWTIRNAIVFHAFIPVSTMGASNLWQGNVPITHLEVHATLGEASGAVERDRLARKLAWQAIRARQPLWIFEKLLGQMPEFWKADSEIVDHYVGRRACGVLAPAAALALEALAVLPYLVLLGLSLIGLARLRITAGAVLLLVMLAAYNLAHVVAYATPRFRLPVLPVVFLLAALALVVPREGVRAPLRGRRIVLLVALAALAVLVILANLDETRDLVAPHRAQLSVQAGGAGVGEAGRGPGRMALDVVRREHPVVGECARVSGALEAALDP